MRRLLAILAVIALVVAACGDDDAAETTAPEGTGDTVTTSPDETTSTTTAGVADIIRQCVAADLYPRPDDSSDGEACANVASEESPEPDDPDLPIGISYDIDHMCVVVPSHVFVFPDDRFSPEAVNAEFGLTEMTGDGLEGLGVVDANGVLEYLAETQLGLYQFAPQADLFAVIEDIEGQEVMASPHYLLVPADPKWKYGPHSSAQPIEGSWADLPPTGSASDEGRVVIIDTGAVGDTDTINVNVDSTQDYSAEGEEATIDNRVVAHGLFAASVVRQFSSSLSIDLYRASDSQGILSEVSVLDALLRSVPSGSDVVNLSLGTYPCRVDDPALGLIQGLWDLGEDVHVIAASGNDGTGHDPMFPAALGFDNPWIAGIPAGDLTLLEDVFGESLEALRGRITAVGAMGADGSEAPFSNTSEVLAPGANVVGWYYDSTGQSWSGRQTSGLAVWSGTSFAAPHFAACVASGACTPP